MCLRIVNDDLLVSEYFMGFLERANTKAETLFKLITGFLENEELKINNLRGQCYDGASNMSGEISGLQTRIQELKPRALYVHCSAHSLNMCVQDSLENITELKLVIGVLKELLNFIRDSTKRFNEFDNLKSEDSPNLTQFCPTR